MDRHTWLDSVFWALYLEPRTPAADLMLEITLILMNRSQP